MKNLRNLSLLVLLLTVLPAMGASKLRYFRAEKSDSIQILFVGNSYTYHHDVPGKLRNLSASIGKKIAPSQALRGGETLKGHYERDLFRKMLAEGGFDYVVIQEASYLPSRSTKDVATNVYPYAHKIDSLAKAGSPDAKILYYMTWGHKYGVRDANKTDYPVNHTYKGMQARLRTSYLEMAYDNKGICAPVGDAWEAVVNERPDIELYNSKDHYHQSEAGAYLSACTILSTILGEPFESDYYSKLPKDVALYLQRKACEAAAKQR